ncbi:MAG TPA: hypothetical protein VGG10_16275 [Rhizomicrobium sp.]|jgi:hypothetical protein
MAKPQADHLAFLLELSANLREFQDRRALSEEERGRYARWLRHAVDLEAHLRSDPQVQAQLPAKSDYADLPEELLNELSIRSVDQLETQIVNVLRANGGTADLDQILIGLYRLHNTIQKRRVVQNKLWQMVRMKRVRKAKDTRNLFALGGNKSRLRKAKQLK